MCVLYLSVLPAPLAACKNEPLPRTTVRSVEGAIIYFYPSFLNREEIREYAEEALFRVGGSTIEMPFLYPETDLGIASYHLKTEEGPFIVIRRRVLPDNNISLRFSVEPDNAVSHLPDQWIGYTLKAIKGPPVKILVKRGRYAISLEEGTIERYVENYIKISLPGRPDFPPQPEETIPKVADPYDPEQLFRAIAKVKSRRVQQSLEERIYKLGSRDISVAMKMLQDPNAQVRESASILLRWLPDKKAIVPVAELLRDTSTLVAAQARYTLNYLLLKKGTLLDDGKIKQSLASRAVRDYINEVCRWKRNHSDTKRILDKREFRVLPIHLKKTREMQIKPRNPARGAHSSCRGGKPIVVRFQKGDSWQDSNKDSRTPLIQFHAFRTFGGYARVAFRVKAYDPNIDEKHVVLLYKKTRLGWQLLGMPHYHFWNRRVTSNFYGPESAIFPPHPRKFESPNPVDSEQFDYSIESLRATDIYRKKLFEQSMFEFSWAQSKFKGENVRMLGPEYIPLLRENLSDKNQTVRLAVLLALVNLGQKDFLQEAYTSCKDAKAYRARLYCGRIVYDARIEPVSEGEILRLIEEARRSAGCGTGVRWHTFERRQQAPETIAILVKLATKSKDPRVRKFSIGCLGRQKLPELLGFWKNILADKNSPFRNSACLGLVFINNKESREILSGMMRNPKTPNRALLTISYGIEELDRDARRRSGYEYNFVKPMLKHDSNEVRASAYRTAFALARKSIPFYMVIDALRDESPKVSIVGLQQVSIHKSVSFVSHILPLLKSHDRYVRQSADSSLFSLLSNWKGTREVRQALGKSKAEGLWEYSSAPTTASALARLMTRNGRLAEAGKAYDEAERGCRRQKSEMKEKNSRCARDLFQLYVVQRMIGDKKAARKTARRMSQTYSPGMRISGRGFPTYRDNFGTVAEMTTEMTAALEQPVALSIVPKSLTVKRGGKAPVRYVIENETKGVIKIRRMKRTRDGILKKFSGSLRSYWCEDCWLSLGGKREDRLEDEFIELKPGAQYCIDGSLSAATRTKASISALVVWDGILVKLDDGSEWYGWATGKASLVHFSKSDQDGN